MRIVEEEKIIPAAEPAIDYQRQAESQPVEEPAGRRQKAERHPKRPRRHSCLRLIIGVFLMLAVIVGSVACLIVFAAGPLVQAVDAVPADFPKELALYELDQAKIRIQSAESKKLLARLINGLPEWSLEPFLGYLTTDLKTQIAAALNNPDLASENLTVSDLQEALSNDPELTQTVNLKWSNLAKSKDDLFDYYKTQLIVSGFTVKENLTDYGIDLSFFKPGIEGAMSITDSFMEDNNSVIEMTVNYLNQAVN